VICNIYSFSAFWSEIDQTSRRRISREKTDVILKVVVKHFFILKDITSTLVMESLYSGLKALEGQPSKKEWKKLLDSEEIPTPIVRVENDMFVLVDDVLLLLERVATEPLPPKDEKDPQNRTKVRCRIIFVKATKDLLVDMSMNQLKCDGIDATVEGNF